MSSFVYGVPTSGTNLPSVAASDVAAWAQATPPATGYAVFGADHPVASTNPDSISSGDWKYADLSYVDAQNYEVTSANYGAGQWLINSTDYDAKGNTVRSLTPQAINVINDWRGENPDATGSPLTPRWHDSGRVWKNVTVRRGTEGARRSGESGTPDLLWVAHPAET